MELHDKRKGDLGQPKKAQHYWTNVVFALYSSSSWKTIWLGTQMQWGFSILKEPPENINPPPLRQAIGWRHSTFLFERQSCGSKRSFG